MTQTEKMTFQELATLQPGLSALIREALSHHTNTANAFCANAVFHGYTGHKPGIKARLSKLVGWGYKGDDDRLRTSATYDTAYHTIFGALPNCRGRCECQGIMDALLNECDAGIIIG